MSHLSNVEEALKKRLVGAVTLVALAVIFVPPLLDQGTDQPVDLPAIPPLPDDLQQASANALIEKPLVAPQIPPHIEPAPKVEPKPESSPGQPEQVVANDQATQSDKPQPVAQPELESEPESVAGQKKPDVAEPPPPPPQTNPNLQAWVVQAASFTQRDNAQKLAERLRSAGFQVPDLEVVQIQNQAHYRVRVGPMLEKSTAEKSLAKINALSGSKARVVPHRP